MSLQMIVAGVRLVKAVNTLAAKVLGSDPDDADGRRVIFLSGDDAPAKAAGSYATLSKVFLAAFRIRLPEPFLRALR